MGSSALSCFGRMTAIVRKPTVGLLWPQECRADSLAAFVGQRKLTQTAPAFIRKYGTLCETMIHDRAAYVSCMTLGKGPTEVKHDKQAAAELDALWAELEVLVRLRVKR